MKSLISVLILAICPMFAYAQAVNISVVEVSGNSQISNTAIATGNNATAVAGIVAVINKNDIPSNRTQNTKVQVNVQNGNVTTQVSASSNQNHCGGVICVINR